MHRKTLGFITIVCLLMCLFFGIEESFKTWMVALATLGIHATINSGNRKLFIVWAPGGNTGLILDNEQLAEDVATGEVLDRYPPGTRPPYDDGIGLAFRYQAFTGSVETTNPEALQRALTHAKIRELKMQQISTEVLP